MAPFFVFRQGFRATRDRRPAPVLSVDRAPPRGAHSLHRFRAHILQRWKDRTARPETRTIFGHPLEDSTTAAEPCCGPKIAHGRVFSCEEIASRPRPDRRFVLVCRSESPGW